MNETCDQKTCQPENLAPQATSGYLAAGGVPAQPEGVCPHCGYCPHCGRLRQYDWTYRYYPWGQMTVWN